MRMVFCCGFCLCFFKQKTAYEMRISDWSSDVCSSYLPPAEVLQHLEEHLPRMAASRLNRKVPWVPPERFHKLDLSKPSLLVPRIAKTLRPVRLPAGIQIGRASCRDRVCQYV